MTARQAVYRCAYYTYVYNIANIGRYVVLYTAAVVTHMYIII